MTITTHHGLIHRCLKNGFCGLMMLCIGLLLAGCSQDKTAGVKLFNSGDAWKALKAQGVQADDINWASNGHQVLITAKAKDQTESYYLVNANGELIGRPKNKDDFVRFRYIASHPSTLYSVEPTIPEEILNPPNGQQEVWYYYQGEPAKDFSMQYAILVHRFRADPSAPWNKESYSFVGWPVFGCDKAGKRVLIERREWGPLNMWSETHLYVVDLATGKETKVHLTGQGAVMFME